MVSVVSGQWWCHCGQWVVSLGGVTVVSGWSGQQVSAGRIEPFENSLLRTCTRSQILSPTEATPVACGGLFFSVVVKKSNLSFFCVRHQSLAERSQMNELALKRNPDQNARCGWSQLLLITLVPNPHTTPRNLCKTAHPCSLVFFPCSVWRQTEVI